MTPEQISRRCAIKTTGLAVSGGLSAGLTVSHMTATSAHGDSHEKPTEGFRYCLNTSTIRGQKLPLDEEIDLIAAAGYSGIEPWIGEIETFKSSGGNLDDLRKRIADHGLTVEDAIGFANWIVDDDAQREKGLEQARRDMDLVHRIGGKRIAAPPVGATKQTDLNLFKAADRYRALLEVGEEVGVVPQVELWGFSSSLSRLGEVLFVAAECGRKDAGVLTDVYHIYKGGSNFNGLKLINGKAMHLMHVNDYPADPPRETINDSHRVYPGDGIAPLGSIFRGLRDSGFQGALSLELFNRSYWEQDAKLVLETGLRKMKEAVAAAFTE